jgi:hypothetical protein
VPYLGQSSKVGTTSLAYSDILRTIKLTNISVEKESDCRYHRFIVYSCDSSRFCGGLGDRQRGMVSAFLLAIVTSRVFVINFDKPCSIENALIPHLYNWSICRNFVNTFDKNKSKLFDFVDGSPFFDGIQHFNFELEWSWQVIFMKINTNLITRLQRRRDFKDQHKWLLTKPMQTIFSLILHTLFKPKQYILNYMHRFDIDHVLGKTLVCSHIRTGGNPTIPNDDIFTRQPNKSVVFEFLKRFADPNKYVLYLASDSDSIRKEFYKKFQNSIKTNVSVVHIDRLGPLQRFKTQACEGLKFAVIEQLILSTCDTLLVTKSGFGINAAYLRGTSNNLYVLYRTSEDVKTVNLNKL